MMYLQHEVSINRDINHIREHLIKMAHCTELSLKESLTACLENNHKLAYAIILRDRVIDEKEKEIDRMCLEFIVKQQPVAHSLRFIFSVIKLTIEIERVGDYAENIARHLIAMKEWPGEHCKKSSTRLAELSIKMFHDAIQSFIDNSPDLAKKTLSMEETINTLRDDCINEILIMDTDNQVIHGLLNIIRRFERVAGQARNICREILYIFTGEYLKHPRADAYRILFVDDHNSLCGQIAEAIAKKLGPPEFIFESAGLAPHPVDAATIAFMKEKGFDISGVTPRSLDQIPNLNYYQVIVALSSKAKPLLPHEPRKTIYLDWQIDDPATLDTDQATLQDSYEKVFNYLTQQITDLITAITGTPSC